MKIDFVLETFFNDLQNQIYNSDIIFAQVLGFHLTLAEIEDSKKKSFYFHYPLL